MLNADVTLTGGALVSAIGDMLDALLAPNAGATFVLDGDDNLTGPQLVVLRRRSDRKCRPAEPGADEPRKQGDRGRAYLHRVSAIVPDLTNTRWHSRERTPNPVPAPVPLLHALPQEAIEEARLVLLCFLEGRDAGGMLLDVGKRSPITLGPATLTALCDLVSILIREGTAIIFPLSKAHLAEATQPQELLRRTADPAIILDALQTMG
ncbi:MAG: hypothetical protein WBA73_16445 [Devosia sp.]